MANTLTFKGSTPSGLVEVECSTYDQAKKLIAEQAKCSPDDIRMVSISERKYWTNHTGGKTYGC